MAMAVQDAVGRIGRPPRNILAPATYERALYTRLMGTPNDESDPSADEALEQQTDRASDRQASARQEHAEIARVEAEVPGLPHLPITKSRAERRMAVWRYRNRHIPVDERRPMWRGWLHAGTLPFAIACGIVLIAVANGAAAKISAAIFMTASILLFGNSALYHRFNWSRRTKLILKRIDHSNILLLIAGTYTPIAVTCLTRPKATLLLTIVWSGAILGIVFRVLWIDAPRWLYVVIYLALGYAVLMYIVDLVRVAPVPLILILVGGLAYTLGAIVYALKRPNPVPNVFGFHEIFHALTVIAFACHAIAIFSVCVQPPI